MLQIVKYFISLLISYNFKNCSIYPHTNQPAHQPFSLPSVRPSASATALVFLRSLQQATNLLIIVENLLKIFVNF